MTDAYYSSQHNAVLSALGNNFRGLSTVSLGGVENA